MILTLILSLLWICFSWNKEIFFILSGIISVIISIFIIKRLNIFNKPLKQIQGERTIPHAALVSTSQAIKKYFKLASYFLWLIKEIFLANLNVIKIIFGRKAKEKAGYIKTSLTSDIEKAIYANSITITPGTIAVSIEDEKIYIHSIDEEGFKAIQSGEMEKRIRDVFK